MATLNDSHVIPVLGFSAVLGRLSGGKAASRRSGGEACRSPAIAE